MTKEEKQALTPKIVFTSRIMGIPKRWLWYLAKHVRSIFSAFALIAKDIDAGIPVPTEAYDADSVCLVMYTILRRFTDDIKWIADTYEADKGKPLPIGEFEATFLNVLEMERLAKECPEAFSQEGVQEDE